MLSTVSKVSTIVTLSSAHKTFLAVCISSGHIVTHPVACPVMTTTFNMFI